MYPETITCWDLIDTFTELSGANREAMKDETSAESLCPNTKQIEIQGVDAFVGTSFTLEVEQTPDSR